MNPWLFIVGSPRSGTTLLARIIEAHSQIAIIHETMWIAPFFKKRVGLTPEGTVTSDLITHLLAHSRFSRFSRAGIDCQKLERLIGSGPQVSYARLVSDLFGLYGQACGKALVGDKTPDYVRDVDVLHSLWPEAKIVHLIRDGRDVCLSWTSWKRKIPRLQSLFPTWSEDPVTTAALWWERNVRAGRASGRAVGPDLYYEVRYETLVKDPEREVQRLCTFLDVHYEEPMLRFSEGRTRADPGLSAKDAWLPITAGLRDWRTQMAAEDIERFEAAVGDLLEELAYPRGVARPTGEAVQRASRIRERFARYREFREPRLQATGPTQASRLKPLFFVVGCARSGTTLLQRIMDAHPQVAVLPEINWITDHFREKKWLWHRGQATAAHVASLIDHYRFRECEFRAKEFEGLLRPEGSVPYKIFLERLFSLFGRNMGKPLVGNKTPEYVRRLPRLHVLWPQAKFVHLIRDGRNVCLSVLSWNHAQRVAGRYGTWLEDPVSTTALWWRRKVELGREGAQELGSGLYYELRYEDLVAQPAEECAKLCSFLGVAYDDRILHFHEGRMRAEPGLNAKDAWLPITPGLRDWRSQMTSEDVERFEAVAGDLLDQLGYPRAFPSPCPTSLQRAEEIRQRFTQDLLSRKEAIPQCWQSSFRIEGRNPLPL
jgi:hypothetical protein